MTTSDPQFTGVVVAAGQSTRFAGNAPKQFSDLAGRSLVEHAVRSLVARPFVRGAYVVLPPEEIGGSRATALADVAGILGFVAGGATRAESVRNGVQAVGDGPFVLVHDAARPMPAPELIDAVVRETRRHGAAVPGLEVPDTVKRVDDAGFVGATLDRTVLRLAQTPQGARTDWLRRALGRAADAGLEPTDESAALEADGRKVFVVAGEPDNHKITTEADLARARRRLSGAPSDLRVGTGFDVHRRGGSDPLVLGGLVFAGEIGLVGHSDADVVLHAAMDALLGAAAMGDIGAHFPPGDPRFAGADSAGLAHQVAGMLAAASYAIVNLDLTILAESPKIGPRSRAMRERIADCFGIDPGRVGVKATTLERLGALGREEGIACQAVALVRGDG